MRVPHGNTVRAFAGGRRVAHTVEDGYAVFSAQASGGDRLDWAVTT